MNEGKKKEDSGAPVTGMLDKNSSMEREKPKAMSEDHLIDSALAAEDIARAPPNITKECYSM